MALHILVADDDDDDLALFVEALKEVDPAITFHCASDGRDALSKLRIIQRPSIIFLDINMPGMDGWHCLSELKSRDEYKDIPVIMFSTSNHHKEVSQAFELGALCFFIKPYDYMELRRNVDVIINHLKNGTLQSLATLVDEDNKNLKFSV